MGGKMSKNNNNFYIKTNRIFTQLKKYSWIFIPLVAIAGLWYPKLGLLMIPVMLAFSWFMYIFYSRVKASFGFWGEISFWDKLGFVFVANYLKRILPEMNCRPGCGACCIAPSISSHIPGMPQGKKAGEVCIHLSDEKLCLLFGKPERPIICDKFAAMEDSCGKTFSEATERLEEMERLTCGK